MNMTFRLGIISGSDYKFYVTDDFGGVAQINLLDHYEVLNEALFYRVWGREVVGLQNMFCLGVVREYRSYFEAPRYYITDDFGDIAPVNIMDYYFVVYDDELFYVRP